MDIKRPPKSKIKKKIRTALMIIIGLAAIGGITYGLTKLKPAAPTLDRSTAVIETVAGVALISGVFARFGLLMLAVAFVGILSPLVFFPGELFADGGPTLLGQYVLKNVVLVAAALVIASRVLRGPARSTR